jgi:hypothetical protein
MKTLRSIVYSLLLVFSTGLFLTGCNNSADQSNDVTEKKESTAGNVIPANAELNALPFTLEFVEQVYNGKPALPRLQSYVSAMAKDGSLLIIGGRRQGLHTFMGAPGINFIPDSSNNFMFVIDPKSGNLWSFNVDSLAPGLSAPLQSTNQQAYHDLPSDQIYIVGGYGWNAGKTDMLTFNTIISFNVEQMVALIKSSQPAKKIASIMQVAQDDRLAVTGGELYKMNGQFYLVFGQKFTGQYRAFGGTDFSQKYTEEVRIFTLIPNSLKILSYGTSTSSNADRPFHRRDGNIIADIDPETGLERIAAFGGVFRPGIIGPYTYPVYINNPSTPNVDTTGNQKFSQYECPVISIYDSKGGSTVYHSFFGGIGHYYYFQTASQKAAYDTVTGEGRNDGFPFVADISTFLETADGNYKEYIHTSPIPGNRLLGSSIRFIWNQDLLAQGKAYPNGVIKLSEFSNGARQLIGYIYGGIEAENPLPLRPNTGTGVSNSLFAVYLSKTPSAAIPAGQGHESTKNDVNLQRK